MAVMYNTPNILDKITRHTHYDGDEYLDEAKEVQTVQVKIIKELHRMVKEKIPLSHTKLLKGAGVPMSKNALDRCKRMCGDAVEMLRLFYPDEGDDRIKESPRYREAKEMLDKDNIHDFAALESRTLEKMYGLAFGSQDYFASYVYDLYHQNKMVSEAFYKKAMVPTEAICSFMGQRYIHPDFAGLDINKMFSFVEQKYLRVQKLKAEYDRLKAEE